MEGADDELMRKKMKPSKAIDPVSVVKQVWGLDVVSHKELESYDDRNYFCVVQSPDGSETMYTLKVHNGVESMNESVLDCQNKVMQHLSRDGVNCPVPYVNPQKAKSTTACSFLPLPVADESLSAMPLAVRLLTWVHGTPLCNLKAEEMTPELLLEAGRFLARITHSLESFEHPGSVRVHSWDSRQTATLEKFLHYIPDQKRRALVADVVSEFKRTFCSGHPVRLREGVLMADFNDANIIVSKHGSGYRISGVIDFGDVVKSWRVCDLTVAMAYSMISSYGKSGYAFTAVACELRGFNAEYKLLAGETKLLRLLAASRLACSCTLGALASFKDPNNKYLLLHQAPAWRMLELLWTTPAAVVDSLFSRALGRSTGTADITLSDVTLRAARVTPRVSVTPENVLHKARMTGIEVDAISVAFTLGCVASASSL